MQTKRLVVLFVLITLVLGLGVGAMTASARTNNVITVNSTDGSYIPGDGKCTLREAINNANNDSNVLPWSPDCAAGSGADTIELGSGLTYTLTEIDSGTKNNYNGLPVITSEMTINGHSSIIERSSAAPEFRIVFINETGYLTLNDLSLKNGKVRDEDTNHDGGGINNWGKLQLYFSTLRGNAANAGGGLANNGIAKLQYSLVADNYTLGFGDPQYPHDDGWGAGILNAGDLELDHSSVSGNKTNASLGFGGGIVNFSQLRVTDSTISYNEAGKGAGLYVGAASEPVETLVRNSSVSYNNSTNGGGIYLAHEYYTTVALNVKVENSTLDYNQASHWGGGLYGHANNTTFTVTNSTLAYNSAQKGSAVFVDDTAVADLKNSTIRYNTSSADYLYGAAVHAIGSTIYLQNTIVSYAFGGPNCYIESGGTIVNVGNNLDDGASCGWGSLNNSLSNATINLGPLQYNGGNTKTMLSLAGSDAIDRGDDSVCAASPINNLDQRGYVRPVGTHCDIGAVEAGAGLPTPTATHTPTSTNTPLPPPTNTPTATSTTSPSCMTAPAAPTLGKPKQNAALTKRRVNLNWSDVPCAVTYEVEVHSDSKTGSLADSATGLSISQFKTKALTRGKTYFWKASACNVHGCTASGWRKFSISP